MTHHDASTARISGATSWRHGVADIQHLRGISCMRAKAVVLVLCWFDADR